MKRTILCLMLIWAFGFVPALAQKSSNLQPAAPQNLEAEVTGHKVTLKWENAEEGERLLLNTFEKEGAGLDDEVSLEENGWKVKTTNTSDYTCTWFNYPTSDFLGATNYQQLVFEGQRSAVICMDMGEDDHNPYQDEWLISPKVSQGAYLQFSYYVDPRVLDAAADPDFTDHYVVQVSTDDGKTWGDPIWDLLKDGKNEDAWQTVTLGLPSGAESVRVAFRAYSDSVEDEYGDVIYFGLHGVWAVDNISIMKAVFREDGQEAPVVAGYEIQLDGEDLARVLALTYEDVSRKTVGKHIYTVCAVTADGQKSEPAEAEVTLEEVIFAAPKNFVCVPEFDDEKNKYIVTMFWDAPDVKYKPAHYMIYSDGIMAFHERPEEEGKAGVGRSDLSEGVYEYAIEAVYKTPDSVSERVYQYVALGVRFGVWNLQAEQEGQDVVLTWEEPMKDPVVRSEVESYTVYRAGEKLTEGLNALTYRDVNVADGLYEYVVIATYADGVESVRSAVSHRVGENTRVSLPYEQKFNTTFLPENWRITNETDRAPEKYTWYFDDGTRLGIKGDGFDGGYAAIDCRKSGGYRVNMALELPAIDLTNVENRGDVTLSFSHSYATGNISKVGVEWYYADDPDKEYWYLLSEDQIHGYKPEESEEGDFHIERVSLRIGDVVLPRDLKNMDELRLRFHYEGLKSNHWAIDNVMVTAPDAAIEKTVEEDASVVVSASKGQMRVQAAQAIERVEIIARNGIKTMDVRGNGSSEMSLPVADRGVVLVRVTTARGVKVVKMLL